jgi:hypothetical protein
MVLVLASATLPIILCVVHSATSELAVKYDQLVEWGWYSHQPQLLLATTSYYYYSQVVRKVALFYAQAKTALKLVNY